MPINFMIKQLLFSGHFFDRYVHLLHKWNSSLSMREVEFSVMKTEFSPDDIKIFFNLFTPLFEWQFHRRSQNAPLILLVDVRRRNGFCISVSKLSILANLFSSLCNYNKTLIYYSRTWFLFQRLLENTIARTTELQQFC